MWRMWRHRKHVVCLVRRKNVPPRCHPSWYLNPGGAGWALVSLMQVSHCPSWVHWGSGRGRDVVGSRVHVPILVWRANSSHSLPLFAALEALCLFLEKRRTKSSHGLGGSSSMGSKGRRCAAPVCPVWRGASLWWQNPRNGVRAGRGHPVPVLEILVVKGGWGVLVQHFPLTTLVFWRVPLCSQVFSHVFFPVFPCVCTRVGVHTLLP